MDIYAGLDVDLAVKLYHMDDNGKMQPLTHGEWIKILDSRGAEMGEMLKVHLERATDK